MQQTGRILVVDHEPMIVDLLIEILTDEGHIAYTVPPSEALATIARNPPALLLLDIRPLDMDGAELIAQLRKVGLATMPIVVMTTAPHAVTPRLLSGAIECLAKPFDLDDLLACVAGYVQPLAAEPASLMLSIGR